MDMERDYITEDGLVTKSKGVNKLDKFFDFKPIQEEYSADVVFLNGENLKNAIAAAKSFKERSIVQEIRDCYSNGMKLVFAVRGMRRTGKTTVLLQACENPEKTIFVSVRRGSNGSIHQLIRILLDMDIHYDDCLIIDEITELKDALAGLHFLYDVVPCKKIIVTGSDSLVLNNPFIEKNNLMRVYSSHNLNYILLDEWCDLTGKRSYEEYVRSLGTLMRMLDGNLVQWFNLSLLDNVLNSLYRNAVIARKYHLEYPLLAVTSVLLQACFGTEIYTKSFRSGASEIFVELFDLEGLDTFLSLYDTARKKFLSEIYWAARLLEDIDYIVKVPQYNNLSDLMDSRESDDMRYVCTLPYVPLMIKSILARVINVTIGNVLNSSAVGTEFENFVVAQIISIIKINDYCYRYCKFRSSDGITEFDLVLEDVAENFFFIEVKYSAKSSVQLGNLENKERFSKAGCSNARKICIYRGKSFARPSANGIIDMVNVIDFFCDYFPKMLAEDPYCRQH